MGHETITGDGNADVDPFGLGGANGGHHACVGYLAISRAGSFVDKKNCAGAGRHVGTNALGKTSKVIGKGANPSGDARAINQVEILEGMAADGVDDKILLLNSDDVRKVSDKTRLVGRMGTSGAMKTRAQIVTVGADWIVQVSLDERSTGGCCRHPRSLYRGGWSGEGTWHPQR